MLIIFCAYGLNHHLSHNRLACEREQLSASPQSIEAGVESCPFIHFKPRALTTRPLTWQPSQHLRETKLRPHSFAPLAPHQAICLQTAAPSRAEANAQIMPDALRNWKLRPLLRDCGPACGPVGVQILLPCQ